MLRYPSQAEVFAMRRGRLIFVGASCSHFVHRHSGNFRLICWEKNSSGQINNGTFPTWTLGFNIYTQTSMQMETESSGSAVCSKVDLFGH